MNTDIEIGGNSAVELRKAVMIYTGTHAYVTVHDVLRDEQGRPHYGPPEALSAEFLNSLYELLNQKTAREIEVLPSNVLCLTDDLVAWWCSGCSAPHVFRIGHGQRSECAIWRDVSAPCPGVRRRGKTAFGPRIAQQR